jgi:DoxX-like family
MFQWDPFRLFTHWECASMRLEAGGRIGENWPIGRIISQMSRVGFRVIFASVWLVNGLFCKVLDWEPRHRAIVSRILGAEHALEWTRAIGVGETLFAGWIFSGMWWRLSAIAQVVLVGVMNLIEFFLAPDLLLFGRFNSLVALAYVCLVGWAGLKTNPGKGAPSR